MRPRSLVFALVLALPAIAQVAILQIRVVEGEGAVHQPGSRAARVLAVEITDETGRPVPGAAVSFQLPENGPGGLFSTGLHTEIAVTDAAGRAALRAVQWNRTPGRFAIRIVASREQARAGTLSYQFIADRPGSQPRAPAAVPSAAAPLVRSPAPASTPIAHGKLKWSAITALVVGGAAAAAVLAGKSSPANSAASAPAAPTLTIGPPTITVGKP